MTNTEISIGFPEIPKSGRVFKGAGEGGGWGQSDLGLSVGPPLASRVIRVRSLTISCSVRWKS